MPTIYKFLRQLLRNFKTNRYYLKIVKSVQKFYNKRMKHKQLLMVYQKQNFFKS